MNCDKNVGSSLSRVSKIILDVIKKISTGLSNTGDMERRAITARAITMDCGLLGPNKVLRIFGWNVL
jgi:hypothetical protein